MEACLRRYCPTPPHPLVRPAWLANATGSSGEGEWSWREGMAFAFHFALRWTMDTHHPREYILAG
eukprot:5685642-Alexandrium_andersonii.AAC.1